MLEFRHEAEKCSLEETTKANRRWNKRVKSLKLSRKVTKTNLGRVLCERRDRENGIIHVRVLGRRTGNEVIRLPRVSRLSRCTRRKALINLKLVVCGRRDRENGIVQVRVLGRRTGNGVIRLTRVSRLSCYTTPELFGSSKIQFVRRKQENWSQLRQLPMWFLVHGDHLRQTSSKYTLTSLPPNNSHQKGHGRNDFTYTYTHTHTQILEL